MLLVHLKRSGCHVYSDVPDCDQWGPALIATDTLWSNTTTRVRIKLGACEEITSDLGLGDNFSSIHNC